MEVLIAIGTVLAVIGVVISLFPGQVFRLATFGMFKTEQLNTFGRRVLRAGGGFCIFEGGLIVLLVYV